MRSTLTPSTVHPENRVESKVASLVSSVSAPTSPLRLVAGGIFCGLLGGTLATMLLSAEIAAGDAGALVMMIPLAAAVVAVVTGWAAAMVLVGAGEEGRG